jgi:putative flippase GtrA
MKNFYKFVCFCAVGGSGALIDLAIFNLFFALSFPFLACRILAVLVSIIYNFILNRNITFAAQNGRLKKQLLKYAAVYGVAISINMIVSFMMKGLLAEGTIYANLASIIGIAASIPFSFLGSLLWAFKKN